MSNHLHSDLVHFPSSEITPRDIYERRREFLKAMALGAGGLALAGFAAREAMAQVVPPGKLARLSATKSQIAGATAADKLTPYELVTTYNNYYEFGTDK